mmetsp:Transcript_27938/g.28350  ORF Transcript_27938/g.28350 Transcript_27938/m.28350 type:complete len:84 (+) Transcript_27938:415-666(+)
MESSKTEWDLYKTKVTPLDWKNQVLKHNKMALEAENQYMERTCADFGIAVQSGYKKVQPEFVIQKQEFKDKIYFLSRLCNVFE